MPNTLARPPVSFARMGAEKAVKSTQPEMNKYTHLVPLRGSCWGYQSIRDIGVYSIMVFVAGTTMPVID